MTDHGQDEAPPWAGTTGGGGFQRDRQAGRGRPRKNSEGGDRGDYVEVKTRILEFYQKFPDGRIQTEIVTDASQIDIEWEEITKTRGEGADRKQVRLSKPSMRGVVTVKASVFRTADDQRPCTGHSWFPMPGQTPYTELSELENAETSAVGRALAMAGISVNKGISSGTEIRGKGSESDDELEADDAYAAWQAEQQKSNPTRVAPEANVTTGTAVERTTGAEAPLSLAQVAPGKEEAPAATPVVADPGTGEVLEGTDALMAMTSDGTAGLTSQALAENMKARGISSPVVVAISKELFGHSNIRGLTDGQRGAIWAKCTVAPTG